MNLNEVKIVSKSNKFKICNIVFYIILIGYTFIFFRTAINSVGFYQWDEHFQVVVFAAFDMGKVVIDKLPWEHDAMLRQSFQPLLALGIFKTMYFAGVKSPFTLVLGLRFFSALLTFTTLGFLFFTLLKTGITKSRLAALIAICTFWFIPFFAARFTSETISGCLILLSICLILLFCQNKNNKHIYLSSILLGLSFLFRFHTGFIILGVFFWMLIVLKLNRKILLHIALIFLGTLFIGFVVDCIYYSQIVFTPYLFFKYNIMLNRMAESMSQPPFTFYFYSLFFRGFIPSSALIIVICFSFFWFFKKHVVTWALIPFIVFHLIISHKELRYIFPIAFVLPLIYLSVYEKFKNNITRALFYVFFLINIIPMLIYSSSPANFEIADMYYLFKLGKSKTVLYNENELIQKPFSFYYFNTNRSNFIKIDTNYKIDLANANTYFFITKDYYSKLDTVTKQKLTPVNGMNPLLSYYFSLINRSYYYSNYNWKRLFALKK